ncbi:MAG TPA: DUF1990 family protein [Pseudonocardiaceae bacterium]|nr:DUF1990 family protein [Pseudonocardiaceae bacterium]
MRESMSFPRRLAELLLRWPVGLVLVSWRYLWRTTVLRRWEGEGGIADHPPELPPAVTDKAVQRVADGVGPLLHRRYRVRIRDSRCTAAELMRTFVGDLNAVVPSEVAFFRQLHGSDGPPEVGDDYIVRMPGPWDGPVRVIRTDASSLRLATLRGHLEAGQIEFRTCGDGDGLIFEIESWARAGDRLSHIAYNYLRLAKEIQLNMWTHCCLRACELAGGRPDGGVSITTHRVTTFG